MSTWAQSLSRGTPARTQTWQTSGSGGTYRTPKTWAPGSAGPSSMRSVTLPARPANPSFQFMDVYANQGAPGSMTPQMQAAANIFNTAGQAAASGQFNPTQTLQAMGPWAAMAAQGAAQGQWQQNPLMQQARGMAQQDLTDPSGYMQDAIRGQQMAEDRRLQDQFASGQITDAEMRSRRRDFQDQTNRAMLKAGAAQRQQTMGTAVNIAQMDQQISQRGADAITDILGSILYEPEIGDTAAMGSAIYGMAGNRYGRTFAQSNIPFPQQGGGTWGQYTGSPQRSIFTQH